MDNRKKAVSIRMSAPDVRSIKKLAKRLGVRDSDVIRYGIRLVLRRLAPLYDPTVRGRNLVPVFVEAGTDLFRHFDLDAMRLDSIINDGVGADGRVATEDLQLLAMSGVHRSYAKLRLNGHATEPRRNGAGRFADVSADDANLDADVRDYLYEKYLAAGDAGAGRSMDQEISR